MFKVVFLGVHACTSPLYRVVYRNGWFFVDYWSFVHFFAGGALLFAFRARRARHPFASLLAALVVWEVVEISLIYLAIHVFRPETLPDQVTDIVVGMAGGVVVWLARSSSRIDAPGVARRVALAADTALAPTMAAAWVGAYGYHYNVVWLNSPALNWLAWSLWTGGLLVALRLHRLLDRWFGAAMALPSLWLVYAGALAVIEYLGYVVLGVHEVTGGPPLAFGLVHGPPALHLFYTAAPLLAVTAQRAADLVALRTLPKNHAAPRSG